MKDAAVADRCDHASKVTFGAKSEVATRAVSEGGREGGRPNARGILHASRARHIVEKSL